MLEQLLVGGMICGGPLLLQSVPEGLYPVRRPVLEQFVKDYPMEGATCWSRKNCEKGAANRSCDALTSIPILPVITGRGGRS